MTKNVKKVHLSKAERNVESHFKIYSEILYIFVIMRLKTLL